MTIINPAKNQNLVRFFALFFAILIVGGIVYIYEYNAVADARFEIKSLRQEIVDLEVKSAELKNDLYQVTDPTKLQKVAEDYNLVFERKPQYLTLSQ